ncbi:decaprenyl-phosphate N-acetylglucosaminephosphotransferase [Arthrobacter sp. Hiyo4]|nr:decaprenyl-phosphate N-acetylglucosaminephosphotransferase [Arthrobacter sp. Hiyo4]
MIMYLLMGLTAAVVSYGATWGARVIGHRLELHAPIRSRDMHTTPVSRLGGVAIFLGVLVALLVASQSFFVEDIYRNNFSPWGVLAGAALIVLVGIADDLLDIRWWVKLIGQSAAALVVAIWGVRMTIVPWVPEPIYLENELLRVVLTAGLIVTTMNAFNFIDGLDGWPPVWPSSAELPSSSLRTGCTGTLSCWTIRTWPRCSPPSSLAVASASCRTTGSRPRSLWAIPVPC